MSIAVARDLDEVGRDAWDDLVRRADDASPFQAWGWHRAWLRCFEPAGGVTREPLLLCLRDAHGVLTGLAPMMLEARADTTVLRFIGDGRSECADLICAGNVPDARARLLDALLGRETEWDAAELNGLPAHSPTAAMVGELAGQHHVWARTRGASALTVLPLDTDAAQGFADAVTSPASVIAHPDAIEAALRAFFIQHIQRWSTAEAQSHFLEREVRDFYRALVGELAPEGVRLFSAAGRAPEATSHAFALSSPNGVLWCDCAADPLDDVRMAERSLLGGVAGLAHAAGFRELWISRGNSIAGDDPAVERRQRVSLRLSRKRPSAMERLTARSGIASRGVRLLREVRQTATVAVRAKRMVEERKHRASRAESHRDFYDAGYNTRQYRREIGLQKPEQTILAELRPALRDMRVLDVGVGAGRTVPFFATAAAAYTGFDFAPNMVAASQAVVGDIVPPALLGTADARDMRCVPDASCGLVLISYNAIDDIGGEADRFKVLAEVKRVAQAGGYFCFSSHNMRSLTPAGGRDAFEVLKRWRRYRLLSAANPGLGSLRGAPTGMIHDPGMDYRFPHYYIAPSAQAKQLADFGFRDVRVFSLESGAEVTDPARWDDLVDSWVYYLCRA